MKIYISRDGQRLGPYTLQQINAGASFGSFTSSDLAWIEGWADWQPLSMVPGFVPPVSAPSPYLPILSQKDSITPRTSTTSRPRSGLSIFSLVCGIMSLFCLGFITGIPAIICGHIARSKIKNDPTNYDGAGMALAGLIMGYVSTTIIFIAVLCLLIVLAQPSEAISKSQELHNLNNAREVYSFLLSASTDGESNPSQKVGFPADLALTSKKQVSEMLVSHGYVSKDTLEKLGFERMDIGNTSKNDPEETVLIRLQPITKTQKIAVITIGGQFQLVPASQLDSFGSPPPREPQFLGDNVKKAEAHDNNSWFNSINRWAFGGTGGAPVGDVATTATTRTSAVVPVLELTKVSLTGKTENFTTLDGEQYTGVIKRVQPDGIVLRTADGVPKIKFKKLPPEVRVKYGYDHDLEIQFLQYENTANMAAYQKQLQLNEFRKTAAIAAEAEKQRLAAEAAEAKAEMMKPPMHIKVIQVIKDGVLADVMHSAPQMSSLARMGGSAGFAGVVGGYESSGNIIFIVGMKGVTDNQELDIKLKRDGIYEYDSVSGANKTIERYSLLK